MRNGWNGVGVIFNAGKLKRLDVDALGSMDTVLKQGDGSVPIKTTLTMPALATHQRDIYLFICGTDDAACAKTIRESSSRRIVFAGKPGKQTSQELLRHDAASQDSRGYVVQSSVACRVRWKGFDEPLVEHAPDWRVQRLQRVPKPLVRAPKKVAKKPAQKPAIESVPETKSQDDTGGDT